jgi:hypothetical protein
MRLQNHIIFRNAYSRYLNSFLFVMNSSSIKNAIFTAFLAVIVPVVVQAQCISGNCQNGSGVMRFSSGAVYTGEFVSGKIHGRGVLDFTNGNRYSGDWQNGIREGQGKMSFKNGNQFEGAFIHNRMTGYGIMQYANGDRYKGNWLSDQPQGKGNYAFKTKEVYDGDFASGKFEGQGSMTYIDGARYTGGWKDNRKQGTGRFTATDGKVTEGTWDNGELVMQGSESNLTGTQPAATTPTNTTVSAGSSATYTRPDINNLRNCGTKYCASGQGYYDFPDGSRYIGEFANGMPQGEGKCFYANGDIYEGGWNVNAPNGEGVMRFTSGRVYGAVWMNGSPVKELEANQPMPNVGPVSMEASSNVRIWAVVVGVADYNHMPKLKYTDNDAYEYAAFLKSVEGGGLPERQVRVLIDEEATRNNILIAIQTQFQKADANDMVIMYFSGHGLEGCFLPYDYDGMNNKLLHQDVLKVFRDSKAKYKLCLGDACHSGTLTNTMAAKSPTRVTLDRYYEAFEQSSGGIALLMSSKGEEVSLEDSGLRRGVFSHYLIKGLKGEADVNGDKIVTISELSKYSYDKVRAYTQRQQTPVITGDYDPDMPVGVVR